MTKARIPLFASADPETFPGDQLQGGVGLLNAVADRYPSGRLYITQRPAINILVDASDNTTKDKGRGVYYWGGTKDNYFVNDTGVYAGSYDNQIGTITTGKGSVFFVELPNNLFIFDYENGEGWVIDSSNNFTLISDQDFPSNIAGGGAALNNTLYVFGADGVINGSNVSDGESWSALNAISAEREPDKGVYLAQVRDHIVAFGERTVEFFNDAGNPTASPLSRRQDISYRVGAVSSESVYASGDIIHFIGEDRAGSLGLYRLSGFELKRISTPSIDNLIETGIRTNGNIFIVSGGSIKGHDFIILTEADDSGTTYSVQRTIVVDITTGVWCPFKTSLLGHVHFPLTSWAIRSSTTNSSGIGMMSNGDVVKFDAGDGAEDRYVPTGFIDADYIDDFYESAPTNQTAALSLVVRTEEFDADHQHKKFLDKLTLAGGVISGGSGVTDVSIRWTDDHYNTYSVARNLSISTQAQKMARCGQFVRRAWEVSYSGTDRLRLEFLEIDFRQSTYA